MKNITKNISFKSLIPRSLVAEKPLLGVALITVLVYSWYSLLRHWHFASNGFDLGIFDQAIWHYSRFEAPMGTIKVGHVFADHFHPILALLGPLFWLFPWAETLLVLQAILFAAAVFPIFFFARSKVGRVPAYLLTVSYALFWGVQLAVNYDFHELSVAVPFIALAVYAVDRKLWKVYALSILVILMTKENLALLVVFFGIYLLVLRHYKQGIATLLAGLVWFMAAVKLIIPHFGSGYAHWSYGQLGADPVSTLKTIVTNPALPFHILFDNPKKVETLRLLFYPFLLITFLSPISILMIPLIGERFLADRSTYWELNFHYSSTISPLLAMAAADGLANLTRWMKNERSKKVVITFLSILILLINIYVMRHFPLASLKDPEYITISDNDRVGYEALSFIPKGASVAAQDGIIPHLSHRQEIYELGIKDGLDYIITAERLSPWPRNSLAEVKSITDQAQQQGYQKVFEKEGWLVLKKLP